MIVRLKMRCAHHDDSGLEIITVNGHTVSHPISLMDWLEEKGLSDGLPFDVEVSVEGTTTGTLVP